MTIPHCVSPQGTLGVGPHVGPAIITGLTAGTQSSGASSNYFFAGAYSQWETFASVGGYIENVAQTVPSPSTEHLTSWFMVDYTSTDYIQGGYMDGVNCPSQSSPVVWLEFSVHENNPQFQDECYPQYQIQTGQSYDFSVTNVGGDFWAVYIYWSGAWNLLGQDWPLAFSTAQATNLEEYAEFYNGGTSAWPYLDAAQTFSSAFQPAGGSWESWTSSALPSTPSDSASQIGENTQWSSYYNSFSVVPPPPPPPDFSISANPSSIDPLPGTTGSSTINLTSMNGFTGYVNLSYSGVPAGSSASISPNSPYLSSNTQNATLTVTPGVAQTSTF
ncbi:MAG: hypothetical protein ACYCZM_01595, partial [Acidimicrobiales bacterium]